MVASTYFNFQWCFQAERYTFLEPIKDKINLYNNHKRNFNILSNINTSVSTKNASKDVLEKGAKECIKENHFLSYNTVYKTCNVFKMTFQNQNICNDMMLSYSASDM